MCRELIADYAPEALVLMPAPDGVAPRPILELLPGKYARPPSLDHRA
jgi:cytidine deaminase